MLWLVAAGRREDARALAAFIPDCDALVEDLVATLDEFQVPKAEQNELLGLLAPMRGDIVEVESPETGLPLPESYEPAPPLS